MDFYHNFQLQIESLSENFCFYDMEALVLSIQLGRQLMETDCYRKSFLYYFMAHLYSSLKESLIKSLKC